MPSNPAAYLASVLPQAGAQQHRPDAFGGGGGVVAASSPGTPGGGGGGGGAVMGSKHVAPRRRSTGVAAPGAAAGRGSPTATPGAGAAHALPLQPPSSPPVREAPAGAAASPSDPATPVRPYPTAGPAPSGTPSHHDGYHSVGASASGGSPAPHTAAAAGYAPAAQMPPPSMSPHGGTGLGGPGSPPARPPSSPTATGARAPVSSVVHEPMSTTPWEAPHAHAPGESLTLTDAFMAGVDVHLPAGSSSPASGTAPDPQVLERNSMLEAEIMRMQRELDAANRELSAQQHASTSTLRDASEREAKLNEELDQRQSQVEQNAHRKALLEEQLQQARNEAAAQKKRFHDEKGALNTHFGKLERELQDTLGQLRDAEARLTSTAEEKQVLREWLDRGTRECDAALREHERTKALLAKTALDWEADHQSMAERLQAVEDEHARVLEDRGALAAALTATRDAVIAIAEKLATAVPMLAYMDERCVALEAGLLAGTTAPPLGELPPAPDIATMPEDPLTIASAKADRLLCLSRDVWGGFQAFHTALLNALQQWVVDREQLGALPSQLAATRAEQAAVAQHNDRLHLQLAELRRECEKWRQLAAKAETVEPPTVLTPSERQALMQARSVAAALYREKEALQRERDAAAAETVELQRQYATVHGENQRLAQEVHRLRMEVAVRGDPIDQFHY